MEMIFNIDERPESIWVDGNDPEFDASELGKFEPEDRAKIKFLIRPMNKMSNKEIIEKNTKSNPRFEFVGSKRTTVQDKEIDWDKIAEDQLDHAIESWQGVNTKKGPIQCNRENKILWANNYPGIASGCIRLSGEILSNAEAEKIRKQKETEKNLPDGQNGLPKDPEILKTN
jgi:hypothetical protein